MWIRKFEFADADGCADLFYRAVHEGAAAKYSADQRCAWVPVRPDAAQFAAKLGAQRCFVADDGAIQGFMSLTDEGYLDMAYVHPTQRGTGLAGQLYAAVLNQAHNLRLRRLTTHASLLARPFFARHGWEVDAPEEIERNGVLIPRFRMFLSLSD